MGAHAESATEPSDLKGSFRYEGDLPDGDGNQASVRIDLRVRLSTLMGEPVVYCTGRWNLDAVQIAGKRYRDIDVPADVWRQVDLVGINLAFPMTVPMANVAYDQVKYAALPCDPGVFYGPGNKHASFNVPGSPAWDRLLLRPDWLRYSSDLNERATHASAPESFVSAEQVKSWLKDRKRKIQFNVDGSGKGTLLYDSLISASVNLWPVRHWVQDQQRVAQAKRQEQRQRKQANAGAGGDPLDAMFAEVDSVESEREAESAKTQATEAADAAKRAMEQRRAALKAMQCSDDASTSDATSLDEVANQAMRSRAKCDVNLIAFYDRSKEIVVGGEKSPPMGYKDKSGNVRIPAQFTYAKDFREGLGIACLAHGPSFNYARCGFVSSTGEFVVIEPEFQSGEIRPFSEGLAAVQSSKGHGVFNYRKWVFINKEGLTVIPGPFTRVHDFKEGRAVVQDSCNTCETGGFFVIDREGKEVSPRNDQDRFGQWYSISDFQDGRATVKRKFYKGGERFGCRDMYYETGVIGLNGEWVSPMKFDKCY